jgi:hypothetical protein
MNAPRTLSLVAGILLLGIGLSLRIAPSVWNGQTWLASDTFSKVGIVLLCLWVAWPAVEAIRRAPGGASVMLACLFAAGLFLYRPKTIYLTGPFLAIAIGVAMLRGWLAKSQQRP